MEMFLSDGDGAKSLEACSAEELRALAKALGMDPDLFIQTPEESYLHDRPQVDEPKLAHLTFPANV